MSRVIHLNPRREIELTQGEKSWIEYGVLNHRYDVAKEQINSILEDRRLRVRTAKWARRKVAVVNWCGVVGMALLLACAFTVITGLIFLAGQLGYFSTQGEWMP